jgi:hypothetical protein
LAKLGEEDEVDKLVITEPKSLLDFQLQMFDLLRLIERERFNLPWRWNTWPQLYQNALQ